MKKKKILISQSENNCYLAEMQDKYFLLLVQWNNDKWTKYEKLHIIGQIPGPCHALLNRK